MNERKSNQALYPHIGKQFSRPSILRRRMYKAYPVKSKKVTEDLHWNNLLIQKQRDAFHVAGHATAIYLNIKAKNLPPVFFQIMLKELNGRPEQNLRAFQEVRNKGRVKLQDGRFINILPASIASILSGATDSDNPAGPSLRQTLIVYEADIVSLLAGSLAEAKHVAETDNEVFSHQLVNLKALKNYGGHSDIALVNDYLFGFSDCQQQRDEKLEGLFNIAFDFINDQATWAIITRLAHSILDCQQHVSLHEELKEPTTNLFVLQV